MIKDILFRAAERKKVRLILVANQPLRTPASAYIDSMVVAAGFDVADDKIVKTTMDTFGYMTDDVKKIMGGRKTFITSADGMSPDNPMLKVLAEIPLAPWIKGHSIIGVQGDGDPKLGDDGVVKYSSAHLDGMESEFVVRSDHSSQLNPLAIDEMRRILVENLENASKDQPTAPTP